MRTNSFYCLLSTRLRQAAGPGRRRTYSDAQIVFVLLWAEHHRQPISWATRRSSYPPGSRFSPPSGSTISRRGYSGSVSRLIESTRQQLGQRFAPTPLKLIDSRPLTVGGASGDRQARYGRAAACKARGYRLCSITCGGVVRAWTIDGLNVNDQTLAARLIGALRHDWAGAWGYVVGDNGFDGNPLHAPAARYNHHWVAPPRRANRNVRNPKSSSARRLRSLDHADNPLHYAGVSQSFGQNLLRERGDIERLFGHSAQLGLGALPPWIRTLRRVRRHVACQLLLLTMRQAEIQRAKTG